ncbi:uncharacterized protein LOC143153827 isoform X1 [Ptiloglossa arizonensis]|uniref:uncharacterized protein LOC143153827 isoform X1 n=1 Tax=Ptiloglossa arizonensis TaxID=3350558 RepID=UPI003FA02478
MCHNVQREKIRGYDKEGRGQSDSVRERQRMRSVENSLYRRRWLLCATVRSGKRSWRLIQKDRAYRLHEYLCRTFKSDTYVYIKVRKRRQKNGERRMDWIARQRVG